MLKQLLLICTLLGCLLAIGGCDDTDIGSIEITLKNDGSGEITVVRVMSSSPSSTQPDVEGVDWNSSAALVVTNGHFDQVSSLHLGEIKFQMAQSGFLRVELPRGSNVKWPSLLTAFDAKAQEALNHSAKKTSIGTLSMKSVKVVLTLPSTPISSGVAESEVIGISPTIKKTSASLIIPLDLIRNDGHPIVWDITW